MKLKSIVLGLIIIIFIVSFTTPVIKEGLRDTCKNNKVMKCAKICNKGSPKVECDKKSKKKCKIKNEKGCKGKQSGPSRKWNQLHVQTVLQVIELPSCPPSHARRNAWDVLLLRQRCHLPRCP